MALFDRDARRLVVRVVYDGPAKAGKTTNLKQLYGFFTARRRGELVTPEESGGRTLYFDWLHLDGGLVGGVPLRCQLLTVPGQGVLSRRRRSLLASADVAVFVCEGTRAGLDEARPMLATLRSFLRQAEGRSVPILVQANKQDLPDALDADACAAALGVGPETTVLTARACEGVGVRETVVVAIRAAANEVQRDLLENGLDALAGTVETPEELYETLVAAEARSRETAVDAVLAVAAPDRIAPSERVAPPEARSGRRAAVEAPAEPAFPEPDVPSGWIWPSARGRETLKELARAGAPRARTDLVARHGTADGSGTSDLLLYEAGAWCLKTSRRRFFSDPDDARTALLQLVRRKILVGRLLPAETVVALQPDARGGAWLWTVTPWMKTLRALMTEATARGDEQALTLALQAYAAAAVDALLLASRRGLVLDVHPSNFALFRGEILYLDDDIATGDRLPAFGHAVLRRVDEYAAHESAVAAYVALLEEELATRFTETDEGRRDAADALRHASVRSAAGLAARDRLAASVADAS